MPSAASVIDLNEHIEIIGQQPGLNIYTQICFCYSLTDSISSSAIIQTLTSGLERLAASFPWVAGQVVNEGAGAGNTGIFKIKAFENIPRLIIRDLKDDPSASTMEGLRKANFPFRMLDENVICPRSTLHGIFNTAGSDVLPVLLLQANFIAGGLVLSILAQHQVMDGTGQGQIINLLSRACHNDPFTEEELSIGNLDRANLIPLLDNSWDPGSELSNQIVRPSHALDPVDPPAPPLCVWRYFTFNAESLTALKELATKRLPSGYVSTDDALCAFIWQSVTRARLSRLDAGSEAVFARAVDTRRYLEVPQTYPGIIQNMVFSKLPIEKLVEEPVGSAASQLRTAVDPKTSNLGYLTRALATLLDRSPNKNVVNFTASLDLSKDIMLSSWARLNSYELDFNLGLGKPESVRRPQFTPVESLMYLLPKTLAGEIALAICLREEDMARLKADEEFAKYGRYIE